MHLNLYSTQLFDIILPCKGMQLPCEMLSFICCGGGGYHTPTPGGIYAPDGDERPLQHVIMFISHYCSYARICRVSYGTPSYWTSTKIISLQLMDVVATEGGH